MSYYISYKGKAYGHPMSREEASMKMMRMRYTFVGLEIVQENASKQEEAVMARRPGLPFRRQAKT